MNALTYMEQYGLEVLSMEKSSVGAGSDTFFVNCGQIDMDKFLRYVEDYRKFATLSEYDLLCMARLFYYQIAVCDYYGQYYASTTDNRHIYLHQAVFSTKLLRWLEEHVETLTARLIATF